MGRHQPPTNRSFYLSVAASTLRFVIIVALVVGGVVVINQAFPETSSEAGDGAIPDDGGPLVTGSPSASATSSPTQDRPVPSPTIAGTTIAVFNGAGVTGLAGDTQLELIDMYDYVEGQVPADAPAPVPVTTIYYRARVDRVEAEYLANDFFGELDGVRVARLPAGEDVDEGVQVAIYLGNDYAALVG